MKTPLLTLVLATLICTPAFAKNVSGETAKTLFRALGDNGVKANHFMEVANFAVIDVRCSSALTGRGVFGTCELYDQIAKKVLRISDRDQRTAGRPVADLTRAMADAGATVVRRVGGTSIDAKSIRCSVSRIRGLRYSCEVK